MKKVLVVSGSARRTGNTMSMVKIIEDKMKERNNEIEFEYLYLIDKELNYCVGCSRCLREGGHNCPLKDEKDKILTSMIEADGIIFASPGYSGMVSGLFKNFIDRFMYLDHIPEFIGKPVLIISTSGGDGVMGAPKFMANNSFYWWGCNIVDIIGIGHAFYMINEKSRKKYNKRLYKAADKFDLEIMELPVRKPNFRQYMYFMFNKTELEVSPDVMPYRTRVWKENGWMENVYYYKTTVNPVYRIIGFVVFGLMKFIYGRLFGEEASKELANYVRNN